MADKKRTHGGHTSDRHKRQTRFGGAAKADSTHTLPTCGVQDLEAHTRRPHGRHNKWQARFGGGARADSRDG